MDTIPGTPDSWWDRYGVGGAVAFLALMAIVVQIRQWFSERKEDRSRQTRQLDELASRVTELQQQLVQNARESHAQTMQMLEAQAAAHEERYQALLERFIQETREQTLALRSLTNGTVEVLNAMAKKRS